jgi:hypothetical protein
VQLLAVCSDKHLDFHLKNRELENRPMLFLKFKNLKYQIVILILKISQKTTGTFESLNQTLISTQIKGFRSQKITVFNM